MNASRVSSTALLAAILGCLFPLPVDAEKLVSPPAGFVKVRVPAGEGFWIANGSENPQEVHLLKQLMLDESIAQTLEHGEKLIGLPFSAGRNIAPDDPVVSAMPETGSDA